ncbi:MAG TPA: Gfo/Idh/MocA family oxidoreductase [Planctomycetia bacterium]|nr:Gfo/Idh/MocA family oxidoreductase [Planctomycetia bacterium]
MSEPASPELSRRNLLGVAAAVGATSALTGVGIPDVHASVADTMQFALVGCGGRGTGAASNAVSTKNGPTKLVAMADVFPEKLKNSYHELVNKHSVQIEVPQERQFVGFDAAMKAMDCLKKGDVVILATPLAFRGIHFKYAIEKGLNVFMEKPITADGPTSRVMFGLAEESEKKGIKVGVGLMCRHCRARQELRRKIEKGELGDITLLRAYRQAGPTAHAFCGKKPKDMTELMYQIQEFHAFLWASGGAVSDFLIHNIDECCWMKGSWPVKARASGGRHYRGNDVDQNFDNYSIEYTFADGAKFFMEGRCMTGCHQEFASYAHGTKATAVISSSGHWPSRARIYAGQDMTRKPIWTCGKEPGNMNPYQLEWEDLTDAIRNNKPYNEARRGIEASVVTSMGRMAAHTGREITYKEMLECDHEFAPDLHKLSMAGKAPFDSDKDGKYPIPQPGKNTRREY